MAGAKETPRQKMIGMMYLVLTALLALNVSKDIINAFVIVNDGLQKTNTVIEGKNAKIMNDFEKSMQDNPKKVESFYKKAKEAKSNTENIIKYIEVLRGRIIAYTEWGTKIAKEKGLKPEDYLKDKEIQTAVKMKLDSVNAKDNYDKPMEILIGQTEDGSGGEARILKNKLIEYNKAMKKLDPDFKEIRVGENNEKKLREYPGQPGNKGEEYSRLNRKWMPWEMYNFYSTILAADVAILNKMIADLSTAESDILSFLYAQITAADFKFDVISAKVIPKSNYVLTGDKYEADIIVAAYSTTQSPRAEIGGQIIPGDSGKVKYIQPASAEGLKKYEGKIIIKDPTGKDVSYPFAQEYVVARPSAIVSPTKMNVFYAGVENPVAISVPGVPTEKIRPSITTGTLRPGKVKGEYIVNVPSSAINTRCRINVAAETGTRQTKPMGAVEFRIKKIPNPVAMVAGKKDGPISKQAIIAAGYVLAVMENFDFELNFRVVSFTMTINIKGDLVEKRTTGGRISDEMSRALSGAGRGQKVYFEDVIAVGPDNTPRKLGAINFRLQ